jgi:hypothetical protein
MVAVDKRGRIAQVGKVGGVHKEYLLLLDCWDLIVQEVVQKWVAPEVCHQEL